MKQNPYQSRIKQIAEIAKISQKLKNRGKTIALVTGCFDVLHVRHVELFQFAKRVADVVIVALDNDESVRRSKGEGRPINIWEYRAHVLSEFRSIDYIFPIEKVFEFSARGSSRVWKEIVQIVKPTHIVTGVPADVFWKHKKRAAQTLGITFVPFETPPTHSSSKIIAKLESEG